MILLKKILNNKIYKRVSNSFSFNSEIITVNLNNVFEDDPLFHEDFNRKLSLERISSVANETSAANLTTIKDDIVPFASFDVDALKGKIEEKPAAIEAPAPPVTGKYWELLEKKKKLMEKAANDNVTQQPVPKAVIAETSAPLKDSSSLDKDKKVKSRTSSKRDSKNISSISANKTLTKTSEVIAKLSEFQNDRSSLVDKIPSEPKSLMQNAIVETNAVEPLTDCSSLDKDKRSVSKTLSKMDSKNINSISANKTLTKTSEVIEKLSEFQNDKSSLDEKIPSEQKLTQKAIVETNAVEPLTNHSSFDKDKSNVDEKHTSDQKSLEKSANLESSTLSPLMDRLAGDENKTGSSTMPSKRDSKNTSSISGANKSISETSEEKEIVAVVREFHEEKNNETINIAKINTLEQEQDNEKLDEESDQKIKAEEQKKRDEEEQMRKLKEQRKLDELEKKRKAEAEMRRIEDEQQKAEENMKIEAERRKMSMERKKENEEKKRIKIEEERKAKERADDIEKQLKLEQQKKNEEKRMQMNADLAEKYEAEKLKRQQKYGSPKDNDVLVKPIIQPSQRPFSPPPDHRFQIDRDVSAYFYLCVTYEYRDVLRPFWSNSLLRGRIVRNEETKSLLYWKYRQVYAIERETAVQIDVATDCLYTINGNLCHKVILQSSSMTKIAQAISFLQQIMPSVMKNARGIDKALAGEPYIGKRDKDTLEMYNEAQKLPYKLFHRPHDLDEEYINFNAQSLQVKDIVMDELYKYNKTYCPTDNA